MVELKKDELVPIEGGGEARILARLGDGGQGVVYKVSFGAKEYALKWYYIDKIKNPKKFKDNIQNNINNGAPSSSFIWPLFLTKDYKGTFGYLMELKRSDFVDFSDFLLAKVHFSGHLAATNAALNVVNAFRELHRGGFSYQDLNDGNFAINPKTGDVCILDNDNVSQFGEFSGIAGKMRYMAPEIVAENAKPDKNTDRFSLAIILFCILFLSHPLEGAATAVPCMREDYEKYFYGINPIFCLDPNIATNRPVRGVHTNLIRLWSTYPSYIRNLFEKAFSQEAMKNSNARVLEIEWQKAFVTLRDCIVTCKCGTQHILEAGQSSYVCKKAHCGSAYGGIRWLEINGYNIPMVPGKTLYRCHFESCKDDVKIVEGSVVVAPNGSIGIINLSPEGKTWTITLQDGSQVAKAYNHGTFLDSVKEITINSKKGIIK